jgi:hypothetical protein
MYFCLMFIVENVADIRQWATHIEFRTRGQMVTEF